MNYPTTPYAISKRACEEYAKLYDVSVVRFPNIYGAGGHSVIDKFRTGNMMVVFGGGEQIRTYAPVESACAALFEYVGCPGVHVLGGRDMTVNQIAAQWPEKPRINHAKRKNDIADGRQIIG